MVSIIDKCLTLTINMQIRVEIIAVVLISIFISMLLLLMSNLIQYHNFTNYYENLIQDEDHKMLLNYEHYIHSVESTIETKSKNDLEFYRVLETMYFENLEGLELNTLLDNNLKNTNIYELDERNNLSDCYDRDYLKCIIYKYNRTGGNSAYEENEGFKKVISYYNLIFPLIKSTLLENCIGVFDLKQYQNIQFYKNFSNNEFFDLEGNISIYAFTNRTPINQRNDIINNPNIIQSNILDNLLNLFFIIPSFNKKLDSQCVLKNINKEFSSIPQITSKHISEGEDNSPYETGQRIQIKENELSFESKIFNFLPFENKTILNLCSTINNSTFNESIKAVTQIFTKKMKDLVVIKWSNNFFDNIIGDIFKRYKNILNIFSLLYSPYATIKENIVSNPNYFFDDKNGISLNKDILERYSCMYLIKKQLIEKETDIEKRNSFSIQNCEIKFNDDFEEYLQNNETEIDIYERKKVKVDFLKYDIKYTLFDKEENINFDLSKEEDKKMSKNNNSFKIYQGIYPSNSINQFSSFLYNNIIFVNFYFTDLLSNYLNMINIRDVCYTYFFQTILIISGVLWFIILSIIIIIVLKISHRISDPIDKLIQPVPMNDNSSRELNKYFQNISYTDDSTINELFVLCKKLIIGGFKSEEDYKQKKKNKTFNAYNNISLVKTNNMIINEAEIMKGEKKQEINFFEKQKITKSFFSKFVNKSLDKSNKLVFKILSGPLFTGKFYQNNRRNLIKDKEYFDLLNNEMISQKKKNLEDNKSKGTKFSILSTMKNININNINNINNSNS